jgi:hypothetical protein
MGVPAGNKGLTRLSALKCVGRTQDQKATDSPMLPTLDVFAGGNTTVSIAFVLREYRSYISMSPV